MFTVNKSNIALRGLGYSSKTSFPSIFACLSCVGPSVHGVPVKVRGHLAGVGSFLQPRESWALNLGHQTWQQVSLLLTHIASQRNSFMKQKGAESYSVPGLIGEIGTNPAVLLSSPCLEKSPRVCTMQSLLWYRSLSVTRANAACFLGGGRRVFVCFFALVATRVILIH